MAILDVDKTMKTLDYILKKYQPDFSSQLPIEIPGVDRNDLALWPKKMEIKNVVVVGVADGKYLEILVKANPGIKFWAVDSWKPYMGDPDLRLSTYNNLLNEFQKRMSSYSNFEVIKKFSMSAVLKFRNNSLDFVFIDANAKDPYISQDISEWYKKLKPGGILAGFNYSENETPLNNIKSAFNNYINQNKIKHCFILGSDSRIKRAWVIMKTEADTLSHIVDKFKVDLSKPPPITISCNRYTVLPELFRELGFEYGAEIGVLNGEYSEVLCKSNPNLKLYSVDAWKFYPVYKNFRKQRQHNSSYEMAKKRLSKYPNNRIVNKWSVDAAKDFNDESLDFVYIDGDHSFPAVTNDIAAWSKKVKKGGIISGHDFSTSKNRQFGHVKDVVCAWTTAYGIHPLFELENPPKFKENSWMWVKQ